MSNTIVNTRTFLGKKQVVQYIQLTSDGTEETNTVVYDSSVVATALGIDDPLTCTIKEIMMIPACSSGAAATFRGKLTWDASSKIDAMSLCGGNPTRMCFDQFGGLKNTAAATGRTGDILLSTAGLDSGDSFTLILVVRPD